MLATQFYELSNVFPMSALNISLILSLAIKSKLQILMNILIPKVLAQISLIAATVSFHQKCGNDSNLLPRHLVADPSYIFQLNAMKNVNSRITNNMN